MKHLVLLLTLLTACETNLNTDPKVTATADAVTMIATQCRDSEIWNDTEVKERYIESNCLTLAVEADVFDGLIEAQEEPHIVGYFIGNECDWWSERFDECGVVW